ncbi:unnamed protein product [Caenorhabditis auriculariae]|uniref:Uncharacterized protein n=1 Tax=Caenorhabditis auriculariae TaxID=2777116 RepID=A0A8S1GUJ0_9PELO|nr:unnamed protein product [Caenorhabditis auriculariae]
MLSRHMRDLRVDDDDPERQKGRRKSARLSNRQNATEEPLHDSGTESDEEEMESIARHRAENGTDPFATWQSYEQFLNGGSPPALSASPPVPRDVDTESWDSFGRESGIMTGDNDSDDGSVTPTPRRRMRDTTFRQQQQLRQVLQLVATSSPSAAAAEATSSAAEKRRYSMIAKREDLPIAYRLRSGNTETVRPVKVAARRIPVRVIINRPPTTSSNKTSFSGETTCTVAPAAKRNRRNSHRPSLDFDKMYENRIETPYPSPATSPTPPMTSSAARTSLKKDSIVTRSQSNL